LSPSTKSKITADCKTKKYPNLWCQSK